VAIYIVPPIASEFLLVEYCTVGAEEGSSLRSFTSVVANMISLKEEKMKCDFRICMKVVGRGFLKRDNLHKLCPNADTFLTVPNIV
jgi:hypothetical protein